MKPRSAKAKGKRLEQKVASMWRSKTKDMAMNTPGSGSGLKFKEDVYNRHFAIECKNQETVHLWKWWQQARGEQYLGKPPVLIISGNHRPILAVMSIEEWLNLVMEAKYEKD